MNSQDTTNVTFHIKPSGWGHCDICNNEIKGLNEPATARLMAEHMLHRHGIKVDAHADVLSIDHDEYGAPLFIQPRRNGTAVTTPTRMDYKSRWI